MSDIGSLRNSPQNKRFLLTDLDQPLFPNKPYKIINKINWAATPFY